MARKISLKQRVSAVKDYMTSGESIRAVSARHGMSFETLRRFIGSNARKKLKRPKKELIGVLPLPFEKESKECEALKKTPNSYRRWKPSEDELLRDAVYSKFTVNETTDLLGRSSQAIYCRKNQLMDDGFIQDVRFTSATGIKRNRSSLPIDAVKNESPVIMDTVITKPIPGNVPKNEVDLRELAGLVKEFGVSITMNVTTEGTNILMHN
jgi:transposase-like protein